MWSKSQNLRQLQLCPQVQESAHPQTPSPRVFRQGWTAWPLRTQPRGFWCKMDVNVSLIILSFQHLFFC